MPQHRWKKGDPRPEGAGRKKGSKNKATLERERDLEYWKKFFKTPEYRQSLKLRILRGKADHMEKFLMEHVQGKAPNKVELTGQDGGPLGAVLEIVRLPDNGRDPKPA